MACCNGVGILCAKKEGTIPAPEPLPLEVSQAHDDHFNIWTGDSPPPTDAIFGEIVGCQPNHGFANWISFNQPITNVTACLGSHATNQTSKDSLAGLRFKIENSLPLMLGRHTSPGHEFSLAKDDKISEVTIALTVSKSKTPQIIGINFKTEKGLSSEANIFGEHIPKLAEPQKQTVSLKSTPSLLLVGMIWSYDLGPLRPAWHGIQPLYKLRDTDTPGTPQLQQALYPSLPWINSPPPHLQLRPIPAPQSNITAFESSVSSADNVDQTGDIASITVFFNAFLQGIELSYHGGRKEAVGNLIGQFQRIELEKGEEIASIEIHERERRIFVNAANAREVVCVEGIKVSPALSSALSLRNVFSNRPSFSSLSPNVRTEKIIHVQLHTAVLLLTDPLVPSYIVKVDYGTQQATTRRIGSLVISCKCIILHLRTVRYLRGFMLRLCRYALTRPCFFFETFS